MRKLAAIFGTLVLASSASQAQSRPVFATVDASAPLTGANVSNGILPAYNRVQTYQDRGVEALLSKDFDKAQQFFDRAIEKHPERADLYLLAGVANLSKTAYGDAEKSFKTALDLRPGDLSAHHGLAITYMKSGRIEEGKAKIGFLEARMADTERRVDRRRLMRMIASAKKSAK